MANDYGAPVEDAPWWAARRHRAEGTNPSNGPHMNHSNGLRQEKDRGHSCPRHSKLDIPEGLPIRKSRLNDSPFVKPLSERKDWRLLLASAPQTVVENLSTALRTLVFLRRGQALAGTRRGRCRRQECPRSFAAWHDLSTERIGAHHHA